MHASRGSTVIQLSPCGCESVALFFLFFLFFFFFYVLSPAPSLFCLLGLTSKVAYRVVSVMPAIKIF